MRTVLVTGFEPFGGETMNPSAAIARGLDGTVLEGRAVVGVVLPCTFEGATPTLLDHVARFDPELVIGVGQAGGRTSIGVERVAINVSDARIPDNAGKSPVDVPVVESGPVGYWSTLPIKAIVLALRAAGIPAEVSQSAGTFVCNHVFYGLMHALAERPGVRGGFIHVPFAPEQTATMNRPEPSLALNEQMRAVAIAVTTALTTERDAVVAGGAMHG